MSLCEFHPNYQTGNDSASESSLKKTNLLLKDELHWGQSYRSYKKKEKEVAIPPKKSPIDIPFKLCRELQRREQQKRKCSSSSKKPNKSNAKSKSEKQPSLLEKSVMTQNQYMEYLSTPRKVEVPPPPPKKKPPCELEPCPPRFVQLAVPNKRRVYENWKAYHEMLPTEVIVRYEQMLHTDKNLEPREARYYYKRLDKKKRKELKKKRMLRKKKQAEKEKGDKAWLKEQINLTTNAIMEYIKEEPLFTLNFKQLMLSDAILDELEKSEVIKKPNRKTKNHYKKTLVEVSDKLAVWMDTLIRFVDIQAVDNDEDIAPLTISSLEEEEEGEEEEMESSAESQPQMLFQEKFWVEGEEGTSAADMDIGGKQLISDFFVKKKGGKKDDSLDMNLLAQLINILENSPDELLQSFVNENLMPFVTYADVLDRLRALLVEGPSTKPKKKPLEEVLEDWAKKNDPKKVDAKMLKEIHNAAELLGEWWAEEEPFVKQGVPPLKTMKGDILSEDAIRKEIPVSGVGEEGVEELEEVEEVEEGEFIGVEDEEQMYEEEAEDEESRIGTGDIEEEEGEITEAIAEDLGEEEGEGEEKGEGEEGGEGVEEGEGEEEGEGAEGAEGEEEGVAVGGDEETQLVMEDLEEYQQEEKEEIRAGLEAEIAVAAPLELLPLEEMEEVAEGEEAPKEPPKEISVIYEMGMEITAEEVGKVIKGHKPSVTFEHSPNMVCCLSLKTWAVWLLEITHNAHNWTKWVHGVIQQVREFAATIRGDVVGPDGKKKVLYKKDWRNFAQEVDQMIVAWRQYSAHVKDLSTSIVETFHGKEVKCCPKCLQDHLIKNVVTAHETLQALTEAMNCAGYWQRTLDEIVNKTGTLTDLGEVEKEKESSEESSEGEGGVDAYIEELPARAEDEDDGDSVYEIEEVAVDTQPEESAKPPSKFNQPGPYKKF